MVIAVTVRTDTFVIVSMDFMEPTAKKMLGRVFPIPVKITAIVHKLGILSNVNALQIMKENHVKQ